MKEGVIPKRGITPFLYGQFVKYMEKQEILSKLTENEKLHGYNYSEIHTISAIGELEEPNVTNIKRL